MEEALQPSCILLAAMSHSVVNPITLMIESQVCSLLRRFVHFVIEQSHKIRTLCLLHHLMF